MPSGDIFELDPQQQGVLSQMKNVVITLSKDDDLVPGLLQELAPPALPADGLISTASRSHYSRYAVASANISRVNTRLPGPPARLFAADGPNPIAAYKP